MSKNTLVIMAAGLGSRYGGMKQLEAVGPSGEIIMDYSIYDAIKAGFKKVVFIIREDIEKEFKEVIGNRISKLIEVDYVIQDVNNIPEGLRVPEGRIKPWGTGHAVLSCINKVKEPFAVINADDFYGREAFVRVNEFLTQNENNRIQLEDGSSRQANSKYQFCMAGFVLGNTLSENGTVSRGVCKISEDNKLVDVIETTGIMKKGNQGIAILENGEEEIDLNSSVSMNMWGFTPEILLELEAYFYEFLKNLKENESKAEYYLPEVVANLIKTSKAEVTVLKTNDKWFGITYKEDRDYVMKSFKKLVREGIYPEKLF
ncbi:sugar phosphate nucleotidyltransferase [Anaeromicropila herbilytica]|uniref:Nucleotidyltransferase n=1 Tax=Anaeromicropila herbilytica TaxID=2785025 RepID=A0A7R7EJK5_9FIRM|nr:sugar phosphate nucleotidyltransferase [Anaeromicropila herbilytica]BCN29642.1 nucleotidyltransferase [Anaeromicropila herbilytica]